MIKLLVVTITIFGLFSCKKQIKPTRTYYDFFVEDGVTESQKIKVQGRARYYLIISNEIHHSHSEWNDENFYVEWHSIGSIKKIKLYKENEIQCRWAPSYTGKRDDVAFKIDIEGEGIVKVFGYEETFPKTKGVWIMETVP